MSEPVQNSASSSEPKKSGFKRKYLRPGEAGSKYIVFRDQRNNNNNNNQNPLPPPPPLQNPVGAAAITGSGSNDVAAVGKKFTGIIDGIFSGGYLISIKVENSNGPILKGLVYTPESQVSGEIIQGGLQLPKSLANKRKGAFEINLNDTESEEEEEKEKVEEEESPSADKLSKALVLYTEPLESSSSSGAGAKLVPVVFKPATDLPYLRKGKSISGNYSTDRDPFLPVNWPSPAIGIPPPSLRNEGTSADSIVSDPSSLPYIGYGRQRERETPTAGREYGRNFKEVAALVNEKMSQYVLSQQTQQNFREKDL